MGAVAVDTLETALYSPSAYVPFWPRAVISCVKIDRS